MTDVFNTPMRNKNATINPKYLDDRCFQDTFALIQHHKKIENHTEWVLNIKLLHNYTVRQLVIKHPTAINKNKYT